MTTSKEHPFLDGGVSNVHLKNGFDTIVDPVYGECASYFAVEKLNQQVAVALAFRHGRLRGLEFQFIRKAMGLARRDLSNKFNRTELTITNWEKTNKVPLEASVLLKQLCLIRFGFENHISDLLKHLGESVFGTAKIIMTFDSRTNDWRSNLHPSPTLAAIKVAKQATYYTSLFEKDRLICAATSSPVGIVAPALPDLGHAAWVEPKVTNEPFSRAWEQTYRGLPVPHPNVVIGHK